MAFLTRALTLLALLIMGITVGAQQPPTAIDPTNASTLVQQFTLTGHNRPLTVLRFSEEFSLISAATDNTWREWNLRDGRRGQVNRNVLGDGVTAYALTIDIEEEVMSALGVIQRGRGRIVVSTTTNQLTVINAHEGAITQLALSPDWRYVLSAGEDNVLRLWETASGQLSAEWQYDAAINALTIDPTSTFAYAIINGTLYQYALADATLSGERSSDSFEAGILGANFRLIDEQLYAVMYDESSVLVQTVDTPEPIAYFEMPAPVGGAALSADGALVAVIQGNDVTVLAVDASMPSVTLSHENPVLEVLFSPEGLQLVTADDNGAITAWGLSSEN